MPESLEPSGTQEGKLSKSEKEATIEKKVDSRLMQLVANDNTLYDALENFLLADPARETPELGDPSNFVKKGDHFKKDGDNMMARVAYETAAKIQIFRLNKDGARECILLADGVTDESDKHHQYQETILRDLDRVMKVASEYYANPTT